MAHNDPLPVELIFPVLIGYAAYVLVVTSPASVFLAIVTTAIILNGWISSRAASEFYSDTLLALDVAILMTYFAMLHALTLQPSHLALERFWRGSVCLAVEYILWDAVFIKRSTDAERRKMYAVYIAVLVVVLSVDLAGGVITNAFGGDVAVILSGGGWLLALGFWHVDKWRIARRARFS